MSVPCLPLPAVPSNPTQQLISLIAHPPIHSPIHEHLRTSCRLYDVYQQLVREGAFEAKLQVRVTAAQLVLLLLQCMRTWEYRVAGSLARCFPGAGHNAASMGVRPQHS